MQSSSFTIEDGEFFMLLGPSGCGKTTTLRMIAGLELPTSGEICIDGEEVSAEARKPARHRLRVPDVRALSAYECAARTSAIRWSARACRARRCAAKVAEVARILGIEDILDKPVGGLSGGDRQRVALGRAIVRDPKAFMMDEPLGALDAEFREHMAEELRALHDRMGATTVYVTHDQLEAMQMGDKIVVMNHGVVEQFGTPQDIYDKPATMFVADFIGSPPMNFLRFRRHASARGATSVALHGADAWRSPSCARSRSSGDLVLGVRPEHVRLDGCAALSGRGLATEYLGTTQIVTLATAQRRAQGAHPPRTGSRGWARRWGSTSTGATLTLFDAQTGRALRVRR